MVLVTGGIYQGKTAFIRQTFFTEGIVPEKYIIRGVDASFPELCSCRCVMNFELWIRGRIREHKKDLPGILDELTKQVKELMKQNPDVIIELQEMGCGIVPMKEEERIYRECCGRIGCLIAENGSEVYRVVCGIAQKIQ